MNPIYKFELTTVFGANIVTNTVYPLYKSDLSKDYEIEQNQSFYRAKLDGKMQFVGPDFDRIYNANFETQFIVVVYISWDAGQTWAEYHRGEFYKTDCEFNVDNKAVELSLTPLDEYTDIMAVLERKYDLIKLNPEIEHLTITKRPALQIYTPGESVIGSFLSNMYWEQECDTIEDNQAGYDKLENDYHFALLEKLRIVDVTTQGTPELPSFVGKGVTVETNRQNFTYETDNYRIVYEFHSAGIPNYYEFFIYDKSDDVLMWYRRQDVNEAFPTQRSFTIYPVAGSGASGNIVVSLRYVRIYARLLTDVDSILGHTTFDLGLNDMVPDNRNYHKTIRYDFADSVYVSSELSETPTEFGIFQPGRYYVRPLIPFVQRVYPIARSQWGFYSLWFVPNVYWEPIEIAGRQQYTLKDAFPIASVIKVLLQEIAPGITHEATADYSFFLYGGYNPVSYDVWKLYVTQKTNILAGNYDQPAQRAEITLSDVLNMLRNTMNLYWFVDNGKFRIEHISWFMNGGSYGSQPVIGVDLTELYNPRNNKVWAFETTKFEYEKETLPGRYQYGWMDDVSEPFEGLPIEIISRFVNRENIEENTINNFTSDIDYMLLNPAGCSNDGFALMAATQQNVLPIITKTIDGVDYTMQNGYMAFGDLLPKYWCYNLPSYNVKMNNAQVDVESISRNKRQSIKFPIKDDINLMQLVKTNMGNGQIQKISINLSSRNVDATLMYDTYNANE